MSENYHPLSRPSFGRIQRPDGERTLDPGTSANFGIVLTVTTVTGGQLVTWREQVTSSSTNATPIDASNPAVGTAMVPTKFGTVAVGDLVELQPIPARDEFLAIPVGGVGGSQIYNGTTTGSVASGATGNVTVVGVGTVPAYNQWNTTIPASKKCIIGWISNESQFQFIAVDC